MRHVFIGGIGYRFLRDHSVGPVLLEQLPDLAWPPGVEIEDLGPGGPLATVHNFTDRPTYDRVVLFGAMCRNREAGQIYTYRWPGSPAEPEEIQARIAEAVTGVISLDNTLIIGQHFGIWPEQTYVVEVEPVQESWGDELSPQICALLPELTETIRRLALDGSTQMTQIGTD